jgi:hypothetical protein
VRVPLALASLARAAGNAGALEFHITGAFEMIGEIRQHAPSSMRMFFAGA